MVNVTFIGQGGETDINPSQLVDGAFMVYNVWEEQKQKPTCVSLAAYAKGYPRRPKEKDEKGLHH